MTASNVINLAARIRTIELLGGCDVCGTLVSARRPWAQAHELEDARCPHCRGHLDLDPDTVFLELDFDPQPAPAPPLALE